MLSLKPLLFRFAVPGEGNKQPPFKRCAINEILIAETPRFN